MNIEKIIEEMKLDDEQARERELERIGFYKNRKLITILATTKTFSLADLIITERIIVDDVITEYKNKGRIVTLPYDDELKKDCWGLCSIRCSKFNNNCRKCIKDFYGVD